MTTTAACLARSFAIVLRQIADLLGSLHNVSGPHEQPIPITYQECIDLQVSWNFQVFSMFYLFRFLLLPWKYREPRVGGFLGMKLPASVLITARC